MKQLIIDRPRVSAKLVVMAVGLALSAQTLTLAQADPAPNAKAVATTAIVPGSTIGMSPIIQQGPGDYGFTQYNQTVIKELAETEQFRRNRADYDYFKSYMEQLNKDFENFQADLQADKTGLFAMNAQTKGGGAAIEARDFIQATRDYKNKLRALRTKIAGVASISSAFPSQTELAFLGQGVNGAISTQGNIKFDVMSANLNKALDALDTDVKNLFQKVNTGSTVPYIIAENSGKGLELDVPLALNFKEEEIADWRKQLWILKTLNGTDKATINAFTLHLQAMVKNFIYIWGTTEGYRFHNQNDVDAEAKEAQRIMEFFWARSYLRAMFGMSQGTMQIVGIKKRIANIEKFLVNTDELATFVDEPLWNDTKYIEQEQSYRNMLEIATDRVVEVISGKEGAPADGGAIAKTVPAQVPIGAEAQKAPFLRRVNSGLTFLKGERPAAAAISLMFQLLLVDVIEERLVIQPGGVAEMAAFYKLRYKVTEEDKKKFNDLEDKYDPQDGKQNIDQQAVGLNGQAIASDFGKIMTLGKSFGSRCTKAEEFEKNLAMVSHNEAFDKSLQERRNRLRD